MKRKLIILTLAAGLIVLLTGQTNVGERIFTSVTATVYKSPATNTDITLTPNGTGNVLISSGMLKFLGTTSSFPAWKRSTTVFHARLADDSGYTNVSANLFESNASTTGFQVGHANGGIKFWNGSSSYDVFLQRGSAANSLAWGGQTSSFPAWKRNAAGFEARLADDSALTTVAASAFTGRYNTTANCTSSASPAVCSAASAGSVVIAAAATTVTVNTTAVTADSQIFVQFDSSLGTKLSVTCNTTYAAPIVTARTAATSFAFDVGAAPVTNPACFSYWILN